MDQSLKGAWSLSITLALLMVAQLAGGFILTQFGNPGYPAQIQLEISSPNLNSSEAVIMIPKWAQVNNASLQIQGASFGDEFLSGISFDLGDDGDSQWEWNQSAYGGLGQQMNFSDGEQQLQVWTGPDNQSEVILLIPAGARIKQSGLNIYARDEEIAEFTTKNTVINDTSEANSDGLVPVLPRIKHLDTSIITTSTAQVLNFS